MFARLVVGAMMWCVQAAALPGMASAATPEQAATPAPAPKEAHAYFIWPADGAVIQGRRFWVRMGLRDMGVAPKGVLLTNTGHHHLLIDVPLPPLNEPIPSDRNHLHFGAGETEARIELAPGRHTLQMLIGDQDHRPHDPPIYSTPITITVH